MEMNKADNSTTRFMRLE